MKPLIHFLSDLRALGVVLSCVEERLICNAPKGVMSSEIRKELAERKLEIIDFLRGSASSKMLSDASGQKSGLPVSRAQKRLWFLMEIEPSDPVYNIAVALRITGKLDRAALEQSLHALVERHESLRTSFFEKDGKPVATIVDGSGWKSTFVDLSSLPEASEQRAAEMLHGIARLPFALQSAPLFKATLVKLSDMSHLLLLIVHHIVADGWSLGILANELGVLYTAFATGHDPSLPSTSFQYRDYVQWEQDEGERAAAKEMPYWLSRLSGPLPILEVMGDRRRPEIQTFAGKRIKIMIEPPVANKIRSVCREIAATPFMLLLAAFKVLLYRYTGVEDILVGSGLSNRQRQEVAPVVGFFVGTLVLRTDLGGDPSFLEVVSRVKETALGAYAHQEMPFDLLVEKLQPVRGLGHNPLVQLMFTFQNVPLDPIILPSLQVEPEPLDPGIARADLSVEVWPAGDAYRCEFEYNTNLYNENTISALQSHYLNILVSVLEDMSLPIGKIPLLSARDRKKMLLDWNNTFSPYPKFSVQKVFESQIRSFPNSIAIRSGETVISYRRLDHISNAIAHYLLGLNLPSRSFIAVCAAGTPNAIAAFLGILKAGLAYLPIDPAETVERLQTILSVASATVLLTTSSLVGRFASTIPTHLIDIEDLVLQATDQAPDIEQNPEDPAYLMFTSGSTGMPKGVVIPHRAIVRLVKDTNYLQLTANEVILQVAPLTFDPSTLDIWGALLNGGTLVLLEGNQRDPDEIRAALTNYSVTTLVLTSAFFHFMVEHHFEAFRSLRQLLVGGDVLSPIHVERVRRELPHIRLINGYGPTENTTLTCCHTIGESSVDFGSVPIGIPIHNTQVFILDRFRQPVPRGVSGELYAAGDGLATGYLNDPIQTSEKFVQLQLEELGTVRAYRTGDMCRYRSDGVIEFLGRMDKQVKLRGFRIELAEVEQGLLILPSVQAAVASVRKLPGGDQRLVAYLVMADSAVLDSQELREALRRVLPSHEIPDVFLEVPGLPWTLNGKIDYEALDALPLQVARDHNILRHPVTRTEEKMRAIFRELLQLETVSIDDDFFALGGHSLLVKQLISKVSQVFSTKLSVASVFRSSSVEALSRELDKMLTDISPDIKSELRASREYMLSRSQRRLWFLDRLDPGNPVYNIPIAMLLEGPLAREAFARSLQLIVERHEVLRTRFSERDGVPYALVDDGLDWQMEDVDISSWPREQQHEEVKRQVAIRSRDQFALDRSLLFRAILFKLGDEEHVVLFVMHHIISDGWSIGVLARELGVLYQAQVGGHTNPLEPLTVQYRDFVAWENQESERLTGIDIAYWQHKLSGELPPLELACDYVRPPRQSFRGQRITAYISATLASSLQGLARDQNASLFMVLFSAFNVLLQQYSRQEDILIGTPTAGRHKSEFEAVLGFFVNNLVLRTDLTGNPSFTDLIKRVRESSLEAFDHQSVPFDQLVEILQPERRLDRSPIFQVMFTLQNAPMHGLHLGNVKMTPMDLMDFRSRYDLAVDAYLIDEIYRFDFEYNADIFEEATIRQMQQHYMALLEKIIIDPVVPISALSPLSDPERHQIVEEWNQTQMLLGAHDTIPAWFRAQAALSPNAIAIEMGSRTLTYLGLDQESSALANILRSYGAQRETVVGIYLKRSPEMVVALLAILKAGAAYLPLDPALPTQRIEFILSDALVPLIVTQSDLLPTLSKPSVSILVIDQLELANESELQFDNILSCKDDLAYLIYTSGSTGQPKGTAITHGSLVNLLASMIQEPGLSSTDTLLAITTLSFDIAALEILGPLVCGAKLVLASREEIIDPGALDLLLQKSEATVMQATPSTWRMLIEYGWMGKANLRMWCGGESLPTELAEGLLSRGRELWNLYGPTETTIWSAAHRVMAGETPILIGRPIGNTRMYILDSYGQPAPIGVPGELYIAGRGVARGYWRNPELTEARFLPDPFDGEPGHKMYRTGDLARYRRDGQIQLIGRTDHQVKLRGYRIELGEIESVIERDRNVLQAAVILSGEGADQELIAYIRRSDHFSGVERLRSRLLEILPEYMVPSRFVELSEMPLTPNSKVDRRRLPLPTAVSRELKGSQVSPRNRIEEQLVNIWSEILGVERVGIRDNFFDLGGHSLLLIRVHARIRQDLEQEIAVVDLFRYPTIESMATWLDKHRHEAPITVGANS